MGYASLLLDPTHGLDGGSTEGIAKAVAWYRDHGVTDTFTHLAQAAR